MTREPEHEQGDIPDDGRNDDPWDRTWPTMDSPATNLTDGPFANHSDTGTNAVTDPPQPAPVDCPGEPDCVIGSTGHAHFIHPPVTP